MDSSEFQGEPRNGSSGRPWIHHRILPLDPASVTQPSRLLCWNASQTCHSLGHSIRDPIVWRKHNWIDTEEQTLGFGTSIGSIVFGQSEPRPCVRWTKVRCGGSSKQRSEKLQSFQIFFDRSGVRGQGQGLSCSTEPPFSPNVAHPF